VKILELRWLGLRLPVALSSREVTANGLVISKELGLLGLRSCVRLTFEQGKLASVWQELCLHSRDDASLVFLPCYSGLV
jgi:hypothetical protein